MKGRDVGGEGGRGDTVKQCMGAYEYWASMGRIGGIQIIIEAP